jgi:hypothetical protein
MEDTCELVEQLLALVGAKLEDGSPLALGMEISRVDRIEGLHTLNAGLQTALALAFHHDIMKIALQTLGVGMAAKDSDTLQLRVPPALKRKLAMDAAEHGVTIRTLILNALVAAGYDVPEDEIRDKRKVR